MKKILLILFLMLLATSLCACADPTGSQGSEDTKTANSSVSTEENITTMDTSLTEEATTETPENNPVFSVDAALAAIDQLASENLSVNLQYETTTFQGLKERFRGNFGQVDGKYWAYVSNDGTAILEEEGEYYHKYVLDCSKWKYYYTYETTDKEEFDKVFNGRYWWKNYLDELTFDAYDELAYVGMKQVLEQDCHIFAFDGTVTDVGQVKLTLYVNAANNNVMKMELTIEYSGTHHSYDVIEATIETLSVRIGDEAKGPNLPKPKWNPPADQ